MNSRFNCQQSFYNEYQNNVHPNHQQRQQNSNQQNNNVTKTNGVVSNSSDKVWGLENNTNLNSFFCLIKSSEIVFIFLSAFYLIMWVLTRKRILKKYPFLKTWQLVFFWGVKTYFGKLHLKLCVFRHGKNWFSQILPCQKSKQFLNFLLNK